MINLVVQEVNENFRITINQGNTETTMIVRNADANTTNTDILSKFGLEKVPLEDIVPMCKRIKKNELIGQSCTICHEDYKCGEYRRDLKCNHFYHKRCIDKWLKKNISCPMCRKEII